MRLKIDSTLHKDGKPFVAARPLVVLKDLSDYTPYGGRSPYQQVWYKYGKRYQAKFGVVKQRSYFANDETDRFVHAGRHAYTSGTHRKAGPVRGYSRRKYFYAVIPEGAEFYMGTRGDVVSSSLVVFKDKRALLAHFGVRKLARPVTAAQAAKG